jgi:hypothetical protein
MIVIFLATDYTDLHRLSVKIRVLSLSKYPWPNLHLNLRSKFLRSFFKYRLYKWPVPKITSCHLQ